MLSPLLLSYISGPLSFFCITVYQEHHVHPLTPPFHSVPVFLYSLEDSGILKPWCVGSYEEAEFLKHCAEQSQQDEDDSKGVLPAPRGAS